MRSIIDKKKLVILVVVLAVATGVVGYFAYSQYRMSQMDKYMLQANQIADEIDRLEKEANKLAEENAPTDEIIAKVDEIIEKENKAIQLVEKAYQYADGPYKELLEICLKKDRLTLTAYQLWRTRLDYIKEGDYIQAAYTRAQEEEMWNEIYKLDSDYQTFKSTHLEVKEHTIKYWKSPAT